MQKSIGMLEFSSVARGIYTSDSMVKVSEVEIITSKSSCPGKYICIIHGSVADVQIAIDNGIQTAGEFLVDSLVIPNVHEQVFPAIVSATMPDEISALGILESYSMSAMLEAADLVLKSATLTPLELRLGTGLGGKAYFTFTGDVSSIETGINVGKKSIGEKGLLINAETIPSPSRVLIQSIF